MDLLLELVTFKLFFLPQSILQESLEVILSWHLTWWNYFQMALVSKTLKICQDPHGFEQELNNRGYEPSWLKDKEMQNQVLLLVIHNIPSKDLWLLLLHILLLHLLQSFGLILHKEWSYLVHMLFSTIEMQLWFTNLL